MNTTLSPIDNGPYESIDSLNELYTPISSLKQEIPLLPTPAENIKKLDILHHKLSNMLNNNKEISNFDIYIAIKENSTFDICLFEGPEELEIIKKWCENIGYYIDYVHLTQVLNENEYEKIIDIFGDNIPLILKDVVLNNIDDVKNFISLEKNINTIKNQFVKDTENKKETKFKNINRNRNDKLYERPFELLQSPINSNLQGSELLKGNLPSSYSFNNIGTIEEAYSELAQDNIQINKKLYIILFKDKNINYYASFMKNELSELEKKILKNNRHCFCIGYEIENVKKHKRTIDLMYNLFDDVVFDNESDIDKLVGVVDNNYKKNMGIKDRSEKEYVVEYISKHYDITSNLDNKMSATKLCDLIIHYLNSFTPIKLKGNTFSFRNRLSKYLIEVGLKKKRFGDGFYYYGLKEKNIKSNLNKLNLSKLEQSRDNDIKNMLEHMLKENYDIDTNKKIEK